MGKVSLVILASGFGRRFGGNKLLEPLEGKPLYQYAIEQAEESGADEIVLVTCHKPIADYAKKYAPDIKQVENDHPERGISESIKRGLFTQLSADGCCFLVSDQPFLKGSTLQKMLEKFRQDPTKIYVSTDGKRRGNPVLFPRKFFGELMQLEGDRGGKQLLLKYPRDVLEYCVSQEKELEDIDYRGKSFKKETI